MTPGAAEICSIGLRPLRGKISVASAIGRLILPAPSRSRGVAKLHVRALNADDPVGGLQPHVGRIVAVSGMQWIPRVGKNGRVKPQPARPQPSLRRLPGKSAVRSFHMSYGRARGLPRTKFSPSAPFHLLDLRSVITVRHRVTRPAAPSSDPPPISTTGVGGARRVSRWRTVPALSSTGHALRSELRPAPQLAARERFLIEAMGLGRFAPAEIGRSLPDRYRRHDRVDTSPVYTSEPGRPELGRGLCRQEHGNPKSEG